MTLQIASLITHTHTHSGRLLSQLMRLLMLLVTVMLTRGPDILPPRPSYVRPPPAALSGYRCT